ncbi:PilZ domain-containing protein [Pseudomonas sp. OHS18]|uniref:PilZ domain-containing protein n=1 Tax=Pseudomonas sp. OHS18 TaxID=3399679 RepID=UPI003A836FA5
MNSSVSPANVVHEAIDERQYVRTKIPARVLLDGHGLKQLECEIQDISLGGLGLIYDQPLTLGSLFNASIKLKLNKIDLNIDAKVKIVSQRGHEVGAEFIGSIARSATSCATSSAPTCPAKLPTSTACST